MDFPNLSAVLDHLCPGDVGVRVLPTDPESAYCWLRTDTDLIVTDPMPVDEASALYSELSAVLNDPEAADFAAQVLGGLGQL